MTTRKHAHRHHPPSLFERFAATITTAAGRSGTFAGACGVVVLWGACGPLFHFSETWQLVINTSTTIVTFLMVFLLQQSQNKDSMAIHLKLNELLASHLEASNRVVAIEDLSDAELTQLRRFYTRLAELAEHDTAVHETHSLDEADDQHTRKVRQRKPRGKAPASRSAT